MEYNSVSIGIHSHESQSVPTTTNSIKIILPFELEKVLSPKTTITPSGKKSAEKVWKFFEMQSDGTYKCLLCFGYT